MPDKGHALEGASWPGRGVSIELWSLRYLSGAPNSAETSSPMARGELVAFQHRFGAQHSQSGRRTSPWRRRGRNHRLPEQATVTQRPSHPRILTRVRYRGRAQGVTATVPDL